MKILALEFSSPQRSVALLAPSDAPGTFMENEAVETGPQSNKPFELIEEVLRQARLDRGQVNHVAIGLGPGSYTGIRAAIALAQGWQLGRGVQLQGISSAECVAAQALTQGILGRVGVVIDAQRGEFYLANFEISSADWRETQPLRLVSQSVVSECEKAGDLLVGPEVCRWFPQGRIVFPRAAILAKLALKRTETVAGENLEPIYLRATAFVKAPPPRVLPEEPSPE